MNVHLWGGGTDTTDKTTEPSFLTRTDSGDKELYDIRSASSGSHEMKERLSWDVTSFIWGSFTWHIHLHLLCFSRAHGAVKLELDTSSSKNTFL